MDTLSSPHAPVNYHKAYIIRSNNLMTAFSGKKS